MIKASAKTVDGKTLLIFGLSRRNTEELLKGRPIAIDGADLGVPSILVLIMGGETEDAMEKELSKHIDTQTNRRDLRP